MLAVPDHLLLPVFRKVFQEDMDFHMDCSEADQLRVSLWVFFQESLENTPTVVETPVSTTFQR